MLSKKRLVLCMALTVLASATVFADKDDPAYVANDMANCAEGISGAAVLLTIEDFKDVEGNVRAQVYGSDPDDFLEKGAKLVRVDVPTTGDGQALCVPLPSAGRYALAVMHDRNANGKADFFSEGFGFSNNPKLSFGPPDADEVMFEAKPGVTRMSIKLSYIFGGDEEQKEKRRQLRRR
ncbi:DUF2141 domain-containing protein [Kordiimonas aestuarii]|uniref:DUF2141 domain-containing protein n=1 Tax=Kordiimonas aestuarii TaxID=1005925 RepID=UPI0021D08A7E|nr:DUF2141 domain-containing protein [Kordiimonas aestuarii]